MLRQSDVWLRGHSATWYIDLAAYEPQQLGYFEQFAFLQGHKRAAVALAYNITKWAFGIGHEKLFATTVNEPVRNLAAIPFVGVISYYLYHCDAVHGIQHFAVDMEVEKQIATKLTATLSGIACPTYIIDIEDGHGKIPVPLNL